MERSSDGVGAPRNRKSRLMEDNFCIAVLMAAWFSIGKSSATSFCAVVMVEKASDTVCIRFWLLLR